MIYGPASWAQNDMFAAAVLVMDKESDLVNWISCQLYAGGRWFATVVAFCPSARFRLEFLPHILVEPSHFFVIRRSGGLYLVVDLTALPRNSEVWQIQHTIRQFKTFRFVFPLQPKLIKEHRPPRLKTRAEAIALVSGFNCFDRVQNGTSDSIIGISLAVNVSPPILALSSVLVISALE